MGVRDLFMQVGKQAQDAAPDLMKAMQVGSQIAENQVRLEGEQQQIQIRKQQVEDQIDEKMGKTLHAALTSPTPAATKMWTKSLLRQGEVHGRTIDQETLDSISNAPQMRDDMLKAVSHLDLTTPEGAATAYKNWSQMLDKPLEDAAPIVQKQVAEAIDYQKSKNQLEAMTGKMGFDPIKKMFEEVQKTGTLDRMSPMGKAVLLQGKLNPVRFYKQVTENPTSPEAFAYNEYNALGSQTSKIKEDLAQEKTRESTTAIKERLKMGWVRVGQGERRLSQGQMRIASAAQDKAVDPLKAQSQLLDNGYRLSNMIKTGEVNKLGQVELRTEITKFLRGANTLSVEELKATDIPNFEKDFNSFVRRFDINKPIPESEKALLLDSFNRVYTSTAVTHDSALQRNLNGMTVSGRIPQDIAQKIMVEHQRGQGQYLIEPGKNRWLLPTGGSPTPNSKSGGEPIQQAPIQQPGGMTKAKARELMLKMKAAGKENDPRYKTLQMMAE